jgi:hypothetical protein
MQPDNLNLHHVESLWWLAREPYLNQHGVASTNFLPTSNQVSQVLVPSRTFSLWERTCFVLVIHLLVASSSIPLPKSSSFRLLYRQPSVHMAGGKQPGHIWPQGPRFNDPKRPKLSAADKRAVSYQVPLNFVATEEMVFCPFHGGELEGSELRCSKCRKGYVYRRVVPAACDLVLVDSKKWMVWWRKKIFAKIDPPFHGQVKYTSEPHVDVMVVWRLCSQDLDGASFRTSAQETNIKILQTTWAVEDFFRFGGVNEEIGYKSCKIGKRGSVVMICPPVEVAHVDSKIQGARVQITFGWCLVSSSGAFRKAEKMPEPAEGWAHVEARARDAAFVMLDCEMPVNPALVAASEGILRVQYPSQEAFDIARMEREDSRINILPRPRVLSDQRLKEKADKAVQASLLNYNPFEGRKGLPSKSIGECLSLCMHRCFVHAFLSSAVHASKIFDGLDFVYMRRVSFFNMIFQFVCNAGKWVSTI